MKMGNGDNKEITKKGVKKGYDKSKNLDPIKKGEKLNPKGRPPKLVTGLIRELSALGYEEVTKSQVVGVFQSMIGLDKAKLNELKGDITQPAIVGIVARSLLDNTKSFEVMERLLDRAHGKPKQTHDIEQKTTHDFDFTKFSDSELIERIEALKNDSEA